jgi:hypothetical protein
MLINLINIKSLFIYFSRESIGLRCRKRRLSFLYPLIKETFEEYGKVNLIDIGGTKEYWDIFPVELFSKYKMHITIVNQKDFKTTLKDNNFTYIQADACDLSTFKDKYFHVAHSNSVIEHVGSWDRMVMFSNEISRIAHKYYVQTPNFWFPVEPHSMTLFFHWLPRKVKIWLVLRFKLGHWSKAKTYNEAVKKVERIHLLNKKQIRSLFKNATIVYERYFLFPKSLIAIKG